MAGPPGSRFDNCRYVAGRLDGCQYVVVNSEPDLELCCPPLGEGALDADAAVELAGILKALADPVRLRLVSLIASSPTGEVCACDLPALLDRSQPTMSHHLSQLVKA